MEENTRLSDLTRMLLSSPSFSGFLDSLSQNPAAQQQTAPAPTPVQQQRERQVRKDVNPYLAQQQMQQQPQIGMAMIPEHHMDFSMLDLNSDGGFYQPQVYSVLSLPETIIDSEVLSGKSSFTPSLPSDDEKIELPIIERAPVTVVAVEEKHVEIVDEEFDADPTFVLYTSSPATTVSKPQEQELDVSSLISALPSKPVQYELVTESNENTDDAEAAMRKVERICESIDRMADTLLSLTINL